MEQLRGADTIILNALRHEPHISHFTLKEAVAVLEEFAAAPGLPHPHQPPAGPPPRGGGYPTPWVRLAYDGLVINC
ncbi:MAG: hypothetical protein WKG07_42195 [Hymenobacter sp.]